MTERASALIEEGAFARPDEADDFEFYARPRLVDHLDAVALATTENVIGQLVVEEHPEILDLMASVNSHIPPTVRPRRVVGMGLNAQELEANRALSERIVHDLNREPRLPLADASFDVVLNTVSVEYMTRPADVFLEVARVLRPGGLFVVTFSNRMFPPKTVRVWRESSESERVDLVRTFFGACTEFEPSQVFVSKGRARPPQDRHAVPGLPSDPVFVVYATRQGGGGARTRPTPEQIAAALTPSSATPLQDAEAIQRKRCPHCGVGLSKWAVPQTPFTEWDVPFMYICFNDECPYLQRSWSVMAAQGNIGIAYRLMLNPERGAFLAVPVPTLSDLRDGIVEGP